MAQIIKNRHDYSISPLFTKYDNFIFNEESKKKRKRSVKIFILLVLSICLCLFMYEQRLVKIPFFYYIWIPIIFVIMLKDNINRSITSMITYQDYIGRLNNDISFARGNSGEDQFEDALMNILKDNRIKVLTNLYLEGENIFFRQIDSVIIGLQNIYVVEVKKWKGLIVGKARDMDWRIYDKGYNDLRENPYQQNQKHVNDVRHLIKNNLPKNSKLINVVVNLERDAIFNIPDKYTKFIYDNWYDLLYRIRWEENKKGNLITSEIQKTIINTLLSNHNKLLHAFESNKNKWILEQYNLFQDYLTFNMKIEEKLL
ncbi:MAG: NERD domain-containing protein [Halanaerobiales bacterium]|nr:NERD domain-containing protein [Halanaerobiales bacterium]